jgi:hypothetical protein
LRKYLEKKRGSMRNEGKKGLRGKEWREKGKKASVSREGENKMAISCGLD